MFYFMFDTANIVSNLMCMLYSEPNMCEEIFDKSIFDPINNRGGQFICTKFNTSNFHSELYLHLNIIESLPNVEIISKVTNQT